MIFGRSNKGKNRQDGHAPQEAPLQGYPGPAPQAGYPAGQGLQTGGYGAPGTWFSQNQGGGYPTAGGDARFQGGNGYVPAGGATAPNGGMNPSGSVPFAQGRGGYAEYSQGGTAGAWPQAGSTGYSGNAGYSGNTGYSGNAGYSGNPMYSGGTPYAGPNAGYGQPNGYAAPNSGYAQGYAQPGGNGIPQTPYATGGNASYAPNAGYGAQAPYAAGYAPGGYAPQGQQQGYQYAQMGRTQQRGSGQPGPGQAGQIPLNGGGYVPPAVPVRKKPFVFDDVKLILLGAGLLAMFVAGFILNLEALLWIFAAMAAATTILFWVQPLIASNKRLCYTVIFIALAAVAVFRATGLPGNGTGDPANTTETAAEQTPAGNQSSGGGTVIDPKTGEVITTVDGSAPTPTPTAAAEDNSATDRAMSFFRYWSVNKYDDMLTLCAPSWLSSTTNPKNALFGLIANRTPLDYSAEKVSGTPDDSSRTVTMICVMDRNNGKDPVKYRLGILMTKDNTSQWYVDPQSLKTYEEAETQDPATIATPTPTSTPPTPANTVLYYNPDGGTKYHLDQNCKSTHAKYLPMKGKFKYSEVNESKYANLEPCNVCAAPLRPSN